MKYTIQHMKINLNRKGNNKMKIQVTIKNVYGNELIYPKCRISKAFADIAKTKTLSIEVLKTIAEMGYQVQVINEKNIEELLQCNLI